jgi:hypothetical protein
MGIKREARSRRKCRKLVPGIMKQKGKFMIGTPKEAGTPIMSKCRGPCTSLLVQRKMAMQHNMRMGTQSVQDLAYHDALDDMTLEIRRELMKDDTRNEIGKWKSTRRTIVDAQ